jgi:hypothetical protein
MREDAPTARAYAGRIGKPPRTAAEASYTRPGNARQAGAFVEMQLAEGKAVPRTSAASRYAYGGGAKIEIGPDRFNRWI